MRAFVDESSRCVRCCLRLDRCLCADIPHVDLPYHVAIVRHTLEARKRSNTGRLAARALCNSSLHVHGAKQEILGAAGLVTAGSWLLFPEGPPAVEPPSLMPNRIIVLDATWSQARRMRQRIAALRGLPVLHVQQPDTPTLRLRYPPRRGALSTLEAITAAVALLSGEECAHPLRTLYHLAVERFAVHQRRTT